ncbi:cytochrome p450 10 [Plakobranchus ocellatus]|uniref:Cytochrome p450 10 n=1 Tax=Plakobranchus ocellatus TaxID=259542 RepID=A0AAV3YY33_9GAST|nr:cytochrome p450 10 [Plakobranchus ocellatus]
MARIMPPTESSRTVTSFLKRWRKSKQAEKHSLIKQAAHFNPEANLQPSVFIMSALRNVSLRACKALAASNSVMPSSARVVSTSPRKDQSAVALTFEDAVAAKTCPFRKSLEPPRDTGSLTADLGSEPAEVKPFSQMPGPQGLPFIGTLLQYFKKDGPKFNKMFEVQKQRSEEFGPIYKEQIGNFRTVIVSSPWEYKKLMRAEGKYPNRKPMDPISHYRLARDMGLGLVTAQGEEWYKQRSAVSKKMLKLTEVAKFAGHMADIADDFVTRLDSVRDEASEVPQLDKELFKWALESIGTFLFEDRLGCVGNNPSSMTKSFIENLEGFFKALQPLLYNLPIYKLVPTKMYKKFEGHADKLFEIGHHLVEKKMSEMQTDSESKSDFLQYLMDNGNMDSKEVTSVAVEMLTGGVETVTNTMTWCLYTLAKNPRAQNKMYQEIREAKENAGGELSPEQIAKLPYVKAVVKETLRKYPITYATSRFNDSDLEIAGYQVPAGSHVQANLFGMYHNADYFYQPEEFLPERWLMSGQQMDPVVKSLYHLVWGHGARMCIGRRIAEQEMHLALTKIVDKFSLSYHHDDVEPVLNTVMTPDRPVRIRFTPRDQ